MGASLTSFNGWGNSWGNAWGQDEPGSISGAASFTLSAVGDLTGVQTATDTHDGYWSKQWDKLRKKKPLIEDVIELVQEQPAIALAEVKEAVKREYPQVDYTQVLDNIQLQRFIAEQLIKALELRRIQDDEDDIEILLML